MASVKANATGFIANYQGYLLTTPPTAPLVPPTIQHTPIHSTTQCGQNVDQNGMGQRSERSWKEHLMTKRGVYCIMGALIALGILSIIVSLAMNAGGSKDYIDSNQVARISQRILHDSTGNSNDEIAQAVYRSLKAAYPHIYFLVNVYKPTRISCYFCHKFDSCWFGSQVAYRNIAVFWSTECIDQSGAASNEKVDDPEKLGALYKQENRNDEAGCLKVLETVSTMSSGIQDILVAHSSSALESRGDTGCVADVQRKYYSRSESLMIVAGYAQAPKQRNSRSYIIFIPIGAIVFFISLGYAKCRDRLHR